MSIVLITSKLLTHEYTKVLRSSKGQTNKKDKAFHFPSNHLKTRYENSETTGSGEFVLPLYFAGRGSTDDL